MCGEGAEQGKPKILSLSSFHFWPLPTSHLKTNSFSLKTQVSDENENKNAKKVNDSFKVTHWIRGITWDYNSVLLSLYLMVFPGSQEASCTLFSCALFDGHDIWWFPWTGPTVLAKTQTAYLCSLRGKLWFRLWGLRIIDLVSSLLMKLLICVPMVFLLHGHLPTQHD